MNPWLLHEVRKDDIAARYDYAERSRIAATLIDDDSNAGPNAEALTGAHRLRRIHGVYWVAGLAVGLALITALLAVAT